jgi:hypothetical protein
MIPLPLLVQVIRLKRSSKRTEGWLAALLTTAAAGGSWL